MHSTNTKLLFRTKDLHRVAIKIINKKQTKTAHTSSAAIMNEVNILRKVKHPCIINLEDVIDTKAGIFLIIHYLRSSEMKGVEKNSLKPPGIVIYRIL